MIRKKILCMTLVIFTIFSGLSAMTAIAGEPPLVITYPSQVNELSTFWVDANIQAYITFNGQTQTGTHVSFQAPPLDNGDETLYIDARSYSDPSNSDMNNPIIIKDYLKLSISSVSPTKVDEGKSFFVTVKDQDGKGLVGATVNLVGYNSGTTGWGGIAIITAPLVNEDKTIEITAEKEGYDFVGGSKTITVKNLQLFFHGLPSIIDENDEVSGYVKDQNGDPVFLAKVTFDDNQVHTNLQGYFSISAPLVTESGNVHIIATAKKNQIEYTPADVEIWVNDIFGETATINCYVYDTSGNNLDALITFVAGDDQVAQTGSDGYHQFIVEPAQGGTFYRVKVSCEGYKSDYDYATLEVEDIITWTFNLQQGSDGEVVEGEQSSQQPLNK